MTPNRHPPHLPYDSKATAAAAPGGVTAGRSSTEEFFASAAAAAATAALNRPTNNNSDQQQQQLHQRQYSPQNHHHNQQQQQQTLPINSSTYNHNSNLTNPDRSQNFPNNNLTMNELLQRRIAGHTHGSANTNTTQHHNGGVSHSNSLSAAAAAVSTLQNMNHNSGSLNSTGNPFGAATAVNSTGGSSILGGAAAATPSSLQGQAANHLALSMGLNNTAASSSSSMGGHRLNPTLGLTTGAAGGINTAAAAAGVPTRSTWRRNSSLGLGTFNTNTNNSVRATTAAAVAAAAAASAIDRRSSLDLLGETAAALDLQEQQLQRNNKKRRHSPEKIPNNTNGILDPHSHQDSIMMNILRSSNNNATANSIINPLSALTNTAAAAAGASAATSSTNPLLTEIDLVQRRADLKLALQRNEAELIKAQAATRRNSLELALQQERRKSMDLAQRRNSLELAAQAQAQRRNSLELALQRQRQEQEMNRRNSLGYEIQQRRNSLELALQQQQLQQQQQRRSSLEFGRRNSLELGRRNSLGSVDISTAPRRFSLDHLYPRRNSTDFLRSNTQDAFMRNLLAEQLLGAEGAAKLAAESRRSSLPMDRRLSNLQLGMDHNPIDPNHLDSLFDDGTQTGRSLGLQSEADALRQAIRRNSLIQAMKQNSGGGGSAAVAAASNAQAFANQAQLLNTQLAAAAQQQQQQQQQQLRQQQSATAAAFASASATTNNRLNDTSTTTTPQPELFQTQVTPFLNAVSSLQDKMQQSQASQKSIQSWDKKMGLKRSHSSTMTKTHRSRKQLRELFEIQKKILEERLGKKKDDKSSSQKSRSKSSK